MKNLKKMFTMIIAGKLKTFNTFAKKGTEKIT